MKGIVNLVEEEDVWGEYSFWLLGGFDRSYNIPKMGRYSAEYH
jgi:hypothetical protein